MFKQIVDFIFPRGPYRFDSLVEGVYADEYTADHVRAEIQQQYRDRWHRAPTPLSHPELFDPLSPPEGWRYDPYYELWINLK